MYVQKSDCRPHHSGQEHTIQEAKPHKSKIIPEKKSTEIAEESSADPVRIQRSRIHSFVTRLQKVIMSEGHTDLLNLLGSTLLNINDIGGQPGFLEMLPALSTGPAMYLVFFDLSKELDKCYKIPFSRDNSVVTPYDAIHTVEATISQILSAITSVHCISHESSHLDITKAVDFGEKFNCFQQVKPVAALIGTHKDQLKENTDQRLENVSKSLTNIQVGLPKLLLILILAEVSLLWITDLEQMSVMLARFATL